MDRVLGHSLLMCCCTIERWLEVAKVVLNMREWEKWKGGKKGRGT